MFMLRPLMTMVDMDSKYQYHKINHCTSFVLIIRCSTRMRTVKMKMKMTACIDQLLPHFFPFPNGSLVAPPAISSPRCRSEPRLVVRQVESRQPAEEVSLLGDRQVRGTGRSTAQVTVSTLLIFLPESMQHVNNCCSLLIITRVNKDR